jgi:hypothetical protein
MKKIYSILTRHIHNAIDVNKYCYQGFVEECVGDSDEALKSMFKTFFFVTKKRQNKLGGMSL